MMLGLFLTDVEPFHTVYLHGLVRAQGGVKMSKTKGNVTDPVEVIDEIGADAVRLALTSRTSPGNDQRLTMAKLEGSRNFANKLWNAARFVLGSEPDSAVPGGESVDAPPSLAERWIRSRLAAVIADVTARLDRLDLGGYAGSVTEFAWSDFCDWYLEMAKIELRDPAAPPGAARRVWRTSAEVLADTLRLLHPVMPFVTEEIWAALGPAAGVTDVLLISAPWPQAATRDRPAEEEFEKLAEVVRAARNLRTEAGIPAGARVVLHVAPAGRSAAAAIEDGRRYLEPLARVGCELLPDGAAVPGTVGAATALGAIWLDERAGARAARPEQLADLRRNRDRVRALLADPAFVAKAPEAVVERERTRLADLEERLRQMGGAAGAG
jgi:valyl-tRNA synthetase